MLFYSSQNALHQLTLSYTSIHPISHFISLNTSCRIFSHSPTDHFDLTIPYFTLSRISLDLNSCNQIARIGRSEPDACKYFQILNFHQLWGTITHIFKIEEKTDLNCDAINFGHIFVLKNTTKFFEIVREINFKCEHFESEEKNNSFNELENWLEFDV